MPTPLSLARQCLTEEAARALDDAVAVARRRSHAQTTSLHAVSALLALPSSTLRDACARARGSAYSPRLQFRALELCVGVSLDRLPSSKTAEDPPISNSLMAAIKRSQANQRRHPENFHLHQMHSNQQTASLLKVELKYFILSILDDPIVSRVFGEAGFRSCDIKLAIIHPPVTSASPRFSRSRCPPIFLCNLTDSEFGGGNLGFPLSEDVDRNCKRIGEFLLKKSGRNPLLVGVSASDALKSFTECVERGKWSVLPSEIYGLSVVCIEKEVSEFVSEGGSEEKLRLKFEELKKIIVEKQSSGPGVVVNFGDLKGLIGEGVLSEAGVSFVVSKLTRLLEDYNGKLWLMGAAASHEMFSKFLTRFPNIDKEWDLHQLPISTSKPSLEGVCSKSSLMGSFVPFGGFFSSTSEYKNPLSSINQSITRCHLCNEKYEQDVAGILKVGSTVSVADQYSEKLPSWLQMTELDTSKGVDAAKTKDDGTTLNTKILDLQKKWNDICQCVHHTQLFPKLGISQVRSQVPTAEGFRFAADRKESNSKDSSLNESHRANLNKGMPMDLQKILPLRQNIPIPVASEAENVNFHSKEPGHESKSQQIEKLDPWLTPHPLPNLSLPHDSASYLSIAPVTTDLGLGTLYASTSQEPNTPKLQDHKERLQHFSGSISAEFDSVSENASPQMVQSSCCSGSTLGEQFDLREYKTLVRILAEKVGWQDEAIDTISQAISCSRTRNGRRHGSTKRDIWLTFLGPDKVGKKRIASALAEIMFGSQESLISVDLSSHDRVSQSNSIFECQELNGYDVKFRGKTVVEYVTGELSKKPHMVVFLENVDKADFLAQTSLSGAIRTGKFPDSHGREISTNNMIFVMTSRISKSDKNFLLEKKPIKYSEERILGAKNRQMKLQIGSVSEEDASRSKGMNVRVAPRKDTLNPASVSVNKRKLTDTINSTEQEPKELQKRGYKAMRSYLDLNLPVEEMEEGTNCDDCDSDSISENSEAWLEDFFDQVDEKVVFKPFDFDALADKLIKQISLQFQMVFGSEFLLDIDEEVVVQVLAAAWLSDRKGAVEDWVEKVLSRTFADAWQKYHLTSGSVVKLVACEGVFVEEQAPGICLPAKINLNSFFDQHACN